MTEPAATEPTAGVAAPPQEETAGPGAQAVAFGVLAVIGAAVFATSFGYGILGEDDRVGPGLLPMVTGLLLLLLCGGQLLVRLGRLRRAGEREQQAPGMDASGNAAPQRVRRLWTVVVATPVAVLLIPLLGFLPALGLLVLFIAAVVEHRPPLVALAVTAVAVAAGYGVFMEFLDVPLPTGLVGDVLGW
ncbi:tripartite tricarboxylate transporter TctB family protein [Pseudonocardia sp. DLS-67]